MRRGGVIFGAGIRFARPPFQNPHANRFGAEALGGGLRREVQIDVPALNRRACVSHQVVAGEAGIAEDADSRTQRQHTRIGRDDTIVRDSSGRGFLLGARERRRFHGHYSVPDLRRSQRSVKKDTGRQRQRMSSHHVLLALALTLVGPLCGATMIVGMEGKLPLPALLSQAMVAFTIEFDNEFEHQTPHRTTNHGSTPGATRPPWLVSKVMWDKFLRHIPEQGIAPGELRDRIGMSGKALKMWLTRLSKWWGYLRLEPKVIQFTQGGLVARRNWAPLTDAIEARWNERLGRSEVDGLKRSLRDVADSLDSTLPHSLPILGYGLFSRIDEGPGVPEFTLPALLSKVLLAFAVEFERESAVSLAIGANVLRLAGQGVAMRELPRLAGVSREAIATSVSFLEKQGHAQVAARILTLTAKGRTARESYVERVADIEKEWQKRCGKAKIEALRGALEQLSGRPLLRGLTPYPDGWRASVPNIEQLPHFPMILHRGGFPDGS